MQIPALGRQSQRTGGARDKQHPKRLSRRWTLLLTADGEIDSDRAAAVKLPSAPTRAKAINPVRRSRPTAVAA